MSSVLQRVEATFPGVMPAVVVAADKECHCEPLVANIAAMRQAWKHVSLPVARALDGCVFSSGFSSKKIVSLGYVAQGDYKRKLKRSLKKWSMKKSVGRSSKVKDPKWQKLVKDALDFFSTPSSWTCVGPRKERLQVRSLCARPTTILRSSPALHGHLSFRQFRSIHKLHFPQYKKARKKTDLCDHCVSYSKKILPRAKEFMQRAKADMEAVCPGYWHPVLKRTKFKSLFSSFDTSSSLTLVQEVLGPLHERCFQQVRAAAPRPEGVRHVEGALLTEARLHAEVVAAYEWHMAAAQLEQNNMRSRVENSGPSRAYCQFDFMEKLPIPISGSETSDQFHGSQRKTLSVFTMYAVERSRDGKRQVSAVVLVSEIIELSALFGSLCVLESLNHIQNSGSLALTLAHTSDLMRTCTTSCTR